MNAFDKTLVAVVILVIVLLGYELTFTSSTQVLKTLEAMGLMALGALIQRKRDNGRD